MWTNARANAVAIVLLACALAACAPGSAPQLIGAYPQPAPPFVWEPAPAWEVVEASSLELWVADVAWAAAQAQAIVREAGGEVVRGRTLEDGTTVELVVVVPLYRRDEVRLRLRALGEAREGGDDRPPILVTSPDRAGGYTAFHVTIRPDPWVAVRRGLADGWRWLAAVVPPVLMAVGAWTVLRALARWWARRGG